MNAFRRLFARQGQADDDSLTDGPGSSALAIKRKRAAIGGELSAHVYWYAEREFIVTSIMSVPGSVILEVGEPSVLPFDVADEDLGRAICEHLLRHDARQPPNLRDRKSTEWPVFRASRDRSVSGFKAKSLLASIETVDLVLSIEAAPLTSPHAELSMKALAQPIHAELGAVVRRALKAADVVRKAGII